MKIKRLKEADVFTGKNQQRATARLKAWRAYLALCNYFEDDAHVQEAFRQAMSEDRYRALRSRMFVSGWSTSNKLAPLVEQYDHPEQHPRLEMTGPPGDRYQEIRPNMLLTEARTLVWKRGVVALTEEPGHSFEQLAEVYFAGQVGEAGVLCPIACGMGLVRILRRRASPEMQEQYLPALLERDFSKAHIGAQFVTEIQGGSDVGANEVRASYADGAWRIFGTKWFCSVADANLFLITAQIDATPDVDASLACFLVPREVDGKRNGFTILELKDKSDTGTKSLATAVIDFDGAVAFLVGEPDKGLKNIVTDMLNTSRLVNVIGDLAMMRQAYRISLSYAITREAFGRQIIDFWDVRKDLALIKTEWLATLYSSVYLTALDELVDRDAASKEELACYRFLVNGHKMFAGKTCPSVLRMATKILGGNGLIADFSILPRLSRDADVLEQWEGPENVLAAQMFNDCRRWQLHEPVLDWISATVEKSDNDERLQGVAQNIRDAALTARTQMQQAITQPEYANLNSKRLVTDIVRIVQLTCLLEAARKTGDAELKSELNAVGELLAQTVGIGQRVDPIEDAGDVARVETVLGKDPERVITALEAV